MRRATYLTICEWDSLRLDCWWAGGCGVVDVREMIDAGGVEWEGFIIRGCECEYILKTAAT